MLWSISFILITLVMKDLFRLLLLWLLLTSSVLLGRIGGEISISSSRRAFVEPGRCFIWFFKAIEGKASTPASGAVVSIFSSSSSSFYRVPPTALWAEFLRGFFTTFLRIMTRLALRCYISFFICSFFWNAARNAPAWDAIMITGLIKL